MNFLFITGWIRSEVLQAVCRTLLHSLWQGLLLAIVTGIVLMLTHKSSSAFRYRVLAGLFVIFLGAICFTFIRQLQITDRTITTDAFTLTPTILQATSTTGNGEIILPTTLIDRVLAFCDRYAMWIVAIWFFILGIKVIRIVTGIGYMQLIRYRKTQEVADSWKQRIKFLATSLRIRQHIALLESGIVKVPMVIGFIKPAILVPVGLLANLPPQQVESILLHELAHIRRKDYLINILQCLAETIFFFNPAVVWLSSLIRDERENCCDDMAIAGSRDKMNYVKALVAFQEYNLKIPDASYAYVAFPGTKKYPMLDRIRRIVNNNNKNLSFMERFFVVLSLVIIMTLALLPKNALKAQTPPPDITVNRLMTTNSDNKTTRLVEVQDNKGIRYRIITVNKVITEFYVNGKQVPVETAFDYKDMIQKIDEQLEQQRLQEEQKGIDRDRKAAEDWKNARAEGIRLEKEAADRRNTREAQDKDGWNKARQEGLRVDSLSKARRKLQADQDAAGWQKAKEAGELDRKKQKEYEETLNLIANDVVKEQLLENTGKVSSFSLGRGEFILNGQKQSFEVYNKFKAKYIKSPEQYFQYNHGN